MTHKATDRHIDALKPKLTTTRRTKTLCSSKHEAHFGDILEMFGIPAKHEPITFTFDDLPKGQATPDWIINDSFDAGNGYMAIEPKGGDTPRAIATWENFCKKVDDPDDQMTAYMLVKWKFMKLHRNGKTGPAALYQCPECEMPFFDFKKSDHICPNCGRPDATFITDEVNKYAQEMDKKIWQENWARRKKEIKAKQKRFDEAKEYEDRVVDYVARTARKLGWHELKTGKEYGEHGLVIGSEYAYEETYPDFVYEELPNDLYIMGHATPPLAIISVCEMPSENDELIFEEIAEAIVKGNTMVKHAILDSSGWRVLDWTTNGEYLPGGLYICDEPDCGKKYVAPHDHECPFCGGEHHHEYRRGQK